jgi:hypothetical protein
LPITAQLRCKDGTTFNVKFPTELNNTDYLRRILGHVTHSMRDMYGELITTRGVAPYVMNGVPKDAASACAHAILKHMIANSRMYARSLSVPEPDLIAAATALKKVRCGIAHDDTDGKTYKANVEDAFANARVLVGHTPRFDFAKANLIRLEQQFKDHGHRKIERSRASHATGGDSPITAQLRCKDGTTFNVKFPNELNNTDYLFRIVRHVTHSMRDVYGELVTTRGVAPYVMNGVPKDAASVCAHAILKHMIANSRTYARSLMVPEPDLRAAATALLHVRCGIAHDDMDGRTSNANVEDAFANARVLVGHTPRLDFAKANLIRLEQQFKGHNRCKIERSGGARR